MPSLSLGFVHLAVVHKQPERNREQLFALCREAGAKGVQLVAAPEMAISGYSFDGIHDMAPYAETEDGPTLIGLAEICRTYGLFACIGMAEREAASGILYNSAFVLDPEGHIVCHYRKMNAELHWACPGDPMEDNTFATPWGRVGVLICADSYHSLMPRVTALRGADLLLVLANWPPVGDLQPLEIWQARAVENGLMVAVCNRTGLDATMDCCQAPSAVISPQGQVLLQQTVPTSALLQTALPLDHEGRLESEERHMRMASRRLEQMPACYLNRMGISNLTSLLTLPPTGELQLCCHCFDRETGLLPGLDRITGGDWLADTLHILPTGPYADTNIERLQTWCRTSGQKAVLVRTTGRGIRVLWIDGGQEMQSWAGDRENDAEDVPFPVLDCGPARIRLVPAAALYHPEIFLACAKKGADLVVVFTPILNETTHLLAGARTIEQVAVVVSAPRGAGIWMPPEGHQRWRETLARPGEHCSALLDTKRTRNKRFQDRIDYRTLLSNPLPAPRG